MTTRPGYVWDNDNEEWVNIGQAAVLAPVSYQATAPTSPATGDIWIDSDDDVPSIDSSVFYRWKKTAVGGETTLSGADDAGLALSYTVGYEELYINGVLQVRGSDYVATTGTTITGLTALVAGDIVTIMSQVAYAVGDTYTQTTADAKFATQVNFPSGAWTAYTPTLTSTSGSITSYTSSGRYTKIGKTVVVWISYDITNNGTGAGQIDVSLPVTGLGPTGTGSGIRLSDGAMIQGFMPGTTVVRLATYSFAYPANPIRFTMIYEAA